jgi:oxygen-independent coproporphyrinogen-3 oxidase
LAPDAEITLEANPGTVDAAKLEGFLNAGVNRLSIGVQSFDDAMLRALGRIHDGQEALRAARLAREAGFTNVNLDLMFGLPGQDSEDALADVQTAIALSPSHISLYQLTLEPNTIFYKYPPALPDAESVWHTQERCQQALRAEGYLQYEVSAYARSGFQCRHNLNYWRFGDYLGIGAGAHGKITEADHDRVIRTAKPRGPEAYRESLRSSADVGRQDVIALQDRPVEFLMNHLRLRDGFPESVFPGRTGLPLDALETTLSDCLRDGLLTRSNGVIRCSDRGWNFLDNVVARFLA